MQQPRLQDAIMHMGDTTALAYAAVVKEEVGGAVHRVRMRASEHVKSYHYAPTASRHSDYGVSAEAKRLSGSSRAQLP